MSAAVLLLRLRPAADSTILIVSVGQEDLIVRGVVNSLARPKVNVTCMSSFLQAVLAQATETIQ
jgi:hypothetical protein